MKKSVLLSSVLGVGLFVFMGNSAFGQAKDANLSVDQTIDQYVTVSKAMPYYVQPDAYFNPNYIAPGWAVSSTFLWSFSVNPAVFNISSATAINPDITIGTVGDYTLNVVETSADGCPDATPTQLAIHVLAAPSFEFGARPDVSQCGGILVATDVLFDIVNNGADAVDGTGDYLVDWTYDVDNLLSDKVTLDDELAASDATNTDVAFTTSGVGKVLANQTFPVVNNKVTRYTFTLTGINEAVSRRSDYIAPLGRSLVGAFTNYVPGADNTFVVMVLPAPTTGPIYHIPNL